jgi:ATP-binding cassette subfamily A (ABC1) protein 3
LKNATGQSSASITTTLRLFDSTASEQAFIQNVNGIFAAIVIAIAFCFVPAAYAVFVVKERESKAKHLQLISGVGVIPFWFANYFWDFMQFMLVGSAASLIILAYNNSNFVGENYVCQRVHICFFY